MYTLFIRVYSETQNSSVCLFVCFFPLKGVFFTRNMTVYWTQYCTHSFLKRLLMYVHVTYKAGQQTRFASYNSPLSSYTTFTEELFGLGCKFCDFFVIIITVLPGIETKDLSLSYFQLASVSLEGESEYFSFCFNPLPCFHANSSRLSQVAFAVEFSLLSLFVQRNNVNLDYYLSIMLMEVIFFNST